jgi:hypothetical protein
MTRTKNTLFIEELTERFTVSLLTAEYYALYGDPDASESSVLSHLRETLIKTCGVKNPTDEDYEYLLEQLNCFHEEVQPSADKKESAVPVKTFCSSFNEFISSLDIINVMGLMTNFNLKAMRELYCNTNYSHARAMINSYLGFLAENNLVLYEAGLYSQGNSYKNDGNHAEGSAIDADSDKGRAMLAQFGVGSVDLDAWRHLVDL